MEGQPIRGGKMTKVLVGRLVDQRAMECGEHELEAARDADLLEQRGELVLDRLLGGAETLRDFTVGAAVEERAEDLALAPGEVGARGRPRVLNVSNRHA